MTFSIVARDPKTGDLGIAVAWKALAVGAIAPYARAGVGADLHAGDAERRLWPGWARAARRRRGTEEPPRRTGGRGHDASKPAGRVVDAAGRAATFTGATCMEWAGGRVAPGVAVQGNILVGPAVVDVMLATWQTATGSLPRRLLAALRAGDAAGGDSRGRQSAALLVVRDKGGLGGLNDRWIDLRIDGHTDPTAELDRLLSLYEQQTNLLDPANLAKIGSAVTSTLKAAIAAAASPTSPDPSLEGTLTASDAES